MLVTRIIPCLDVEDGRVVKGIKFKEIKDAGDPVELARKYYEDGADELIFLDIGATYRSKETMIETVEKVSKEVFIPLTVGGGIRTIEDIRKLLNAGADKVSMCSSAIKDPSLIEEGAKIFGSQCIILSVDAKRYKNTWHAYTHGGRKDSGLDVLEWVKKAEELGIGEVLLNSIDQDGTESGYDIELTKTISELVNVPVIASGGAGNLEQIQEAITKGYADAVLIASLLHYGKYTIEEIKKYLKNNGVNVR